LGHRFINMNFSIKQKFKSIIREFNEILEESYPIENFIDIDKLDDIIVRTKLVSIRVNSLARESKSHLELLLALHHQDKDFDKLKANRQCKAIQEYLLDLHNAIELKRATDLLADIEVISKTYGTYILES
jgi:hypothetical protein